MPEPTHHDPHPDTRQVPGLSRRGFLRTALGGAALLVLQACGRAPGPQPGPTPTQAPPSPTAVPTATGAATATGTVPSTATATATAAEAGSLHLPLVSVPGDAPAPSPTATATATATATPEPTVPAPPTATATATAIPRPQPTPFPPGPATKLGLHVGYQHPALEELLRTGNVPFVKTLEYDPNLVQFIKEISPDTIIVARFTPLAQLALADVDPLQAARDFVNLILPLAIEPRRLAHIDAWEAYNEPGVSTPEQMQRLATFEAERTRLLAAAGIRSCVGNFGTGAPALELWPHFFPAIRAVQQHNGFLGLHEYSAPYIWFGTGRYQLNPEQDEGDEGWLTLRYRKVYRQHLQPNGLEVPLLITETGVDGAVSPRPGPQGLGWMDFADFWESENQIRTTAAGFYMEQLAWYDAELQQDPYVRGASIFILGATPGWETFELVGEPAALLHQYLSVHPRR